MRAATIREGRIEVVEHPDPEPQDGKLLVRVKAAGLNGESVRSFFGVHKLTRTGDGRFLTLSHGTTIHGAIRIANDDGTAVAGRPEPTTYYTYEGAIGSAIASVRQALPERFISPTHSAAPRPCH